MSSEGRPDLDQQLADLQQHRIPSSALYGTLHEFGRANYLTGRADVERFLQSDDPELRYIALEVLTHHWHLSEHWETARHFLEHDPDTECRCMGASALGTLQANTHDKRTLALLARVVRNEQETAGVRQAAYAALRRIVRDDPREQLELAAKDVDFTNEADWTLVDRYIVSS